MFLKIKIDLHQFKLFQDELCLTFTHGSIIRKLPSPEESYHPLPHVNYEDLELVLRKWILFPCVFWKTKDKCSGDLYLVIFFFLFWSLYIFSLTKRLVIFFSKTYNVIVKCQNKIIFLKRSCFSYCYSQLQSTFIKQYSLFAIIYHDQNNLLNQLTIKNIYNFFLL